jgi:hypothetical protein|tara:strand:+ start:198 stop:476 length:279 start_codon:yes stop_codon:yes gene_type:complete
MAELSPQDVFGGVEPLTKLCEELDFVFPHYLPQPSDSISTIMFRAGQREVVEYLIQKLEDDNHVHGFTKPSQTAPAAAAGPYSTTTAADDRA